MATYSIADIEKLSGVKAHTIRMWEKRYNILPSKRSNSNIRYYEEDDLQLILSIAFLNKKGIKISKIATLSPTEIMSRVANSCKMTREVGEIDGLLLSIFELSEYKFLKILNHQIEEVGFESAMEQTIYPLVEKLSYLWVSGAITAIHENFVSGIIRRKVSVEIDKLDPVFECCAPKYLVYLPDNEAHELSLLYIYYILRKQGVNVLYLGSPISLTDVIQGVEIFNPDYIFTLFNDGYPDKSLQTYLSDLARYAPNCRKIITGYQTIQQKLKLDDTFSVIHDLKRIKDFIPQ